MFNALTELLQFLWQGITAYASTDEGREQLQQILDALEADGIDVPFYEPQQPLDVNQQEGSFRSNYSDFLTRHPEFVKENPEE